MAVSLARNGPWLASMLLASLIAVDLARAVVMLVGTRPVKSVQLPARMRPGSGLQHAAINVQSIASAHLFGVAAPEQSAQDPDHAPMSSANLVLAGTIATNDPKHGVAIISDGGPSRVYSVGDNVSGASLHSVYLDHVILNRAGVLETLLLPRQLPAARPVAARAAPGPGPMQNLRRMVENDPNVLSQIMRAVPSYDSAAGKLRGFRIYPGRNRTAFNNLGLRPGDLVTAINGAALDDPQRGQEIMNTVETSDRATVTIERGGQAQDLTLNIAQVANEATNEINAGNAAAAAAAATTPTPVPAMPSGVPGGVPGGAANPATGLATQTGGSPFSRLPFGARAPGGRPGASPPIQPPDATLDSSDN